MDETTRNEDGWVMARLVALEQANRRLWVGLGALFMTILSVCLAAFLVVGNVDLPAHARRRGRAPAEVSWPTT